LELPRKLAVEARKSLLPVASISLVALTVLILYWQDLLILANEALQNEATNHIILVPILAAFLVYKKRELAGASFAIEKFRRKNYIFSLSEATGIALCLSAFLLYWYGSFTFYPIELHVVSLTLFLIGVTLTLSNVKTLIAIIFPILFLLFLMPPPTAITLTAGAALGDFNAQASYSLLKLLGVPVTLSSEYGPPTILINNPSERSAEFAVDQACSGIYSLIAFAMFAAFLIYIVKGPYRKKIALVPIGFFMLPILNILRISLIVLIAHKASAEIAMTIFHTYSGWLMLSTGMLLLLLIAEKILHMKIYEPRSKIATCDKCNDASRNNDPFCSNCGIFHGNHQASFNSKFWIKITALLLASCAVALTLQAPVFALAQGLTLTNTDPGSSTAVFPQISDYQLNYLYRDENFERISRTDASFTYAYFPKNVSNPTIYLLLGVGNSITNLHNWEVCLVTWQQAQGRTPVVNVLESKDVQLIENPPIIARSFVFQYPADYRALANYAQVTLYWYQKALFKTGLTVESRYVRISLIILTTDPIEQAKLGQKLLDLGRATASYWEPMKTQSLLSLSIPTMQILLGSTIIFAILIQTTEYSRQWRTKSTNLKIFERYGSPDEKLLLKRIQELRQKTKETTTMNIESAFKEETANSGKHYDLLSTLENLQKNGIIQLNIINIQDQPRLVWKP